MKKYKLFLGIVLSILFETATAQTEWNTIIKIYNGNEYIIKNSEYIYAIKNIKYDFSDVTCDVEFEGESDKEFNIRRESVCKEIYEILNNIFNFNNIPFNLDESYQLLIVCYFDSTTKNYIGAKFIFDTEVKDYFTLEKINHAEVQLSKANINAGRTNLLNPNKKYFTIDITMPIGN